MPWDGRPTFVISIDLEMSWGAVHHGHPHDPSPYESEREIVAGVLERMSRYGIAATWAIVGHLYLDRCDRNDGGHAHADIKRPNYPWMSQDWYALDPATDVARDPTWYGPDLVDMIEQCPVPQEIASHSFGHVMAGEAGCGPDAFASDLAAARAVAAPRDHQLRSFVFPRNSIGHLDVLADAGFTAFRGPRPTGPHPIVPTIRGSLVDVPQTYLFDPDSRNAGLFGSRGWAMVVRSRLRQAVREDSMFHLWFHTHNLATQPDKAWHALEVVFEDARRLIDAGNLRNLTMGGVAEMTLNR